MIDAGADTKIISLLDTRQQTISGRNVETARNNRLSYAIRCHAAATYCSSFLYDSVGPARAHPRLPGLYRPYGLWVHGVEVWYSLSPERRRALARADFVLANSNYTLKKFSEIHGRLKNAQICWLATEEDEPPERHFRLEHRPTALIIGRIDDGLGYKGHKELVDCWPDVMRHLPGARLLIAGDGPGRPQLAEMVAKSPVRQSICVVGFVEEAKLDKLWQRGDLFVMPSRGEGFGLVYIEAMRRSLPVIASVHDAGSEINLDGITGFNVDLSNSGELAARIIQLFKNEHLSKQMGHNGYKRWHEHFRYSVFKRRFLEKLRRSTVGGQGRLVNR